jgi:SOS response regulatory protein OraA/RecX
MKVNPFSKKSTASAAPKPVANASPLNEIGDVSAVATMFARLRQQNAQYDQAIAALIAANRITNGWDKPAEPDMTLTIQREVLVALGDTEALAKFDQEHQQQLAQEQAERVKATQQVLEAPTRVKALEQYINDLAGQMVEGYDQTMVEREAERMFVQAWREMRTVEAVLLSRIQLLHYSVTGEFRTRPALALIGTARNGELLPTMIEGLKLDEVNAINRDFTAVDPELLRALDSALDGAGFDGSGINIYHPKSNSDERCIYAPDPNPPKKHLGHGTGMATVVRVDV